MDFCDWAPWVFSALAGTLGWLLRGWYNQRQFTELNETIKTKEDDLYHLNEAHNLVLLDKEKKLAESEEDAQMKDRVIGELRQQLTQTETSTKSLLSKVVKSKEKKPESPSIVSKIAKQAKKNKEIREQPLKKEKAVALKTKKIEASKSEAIDAVVSAPEKSKLSKIDRYRLKLKKRNRIIKDLRSENERLNEAQKLETVDVKPIETITKVLITKTVDYKKLKKALKKVPFKKTKKVTSKKRNEA